MRFWLGPWTWEATPIPNWRPPTGTLSSLDLRSNEQAGTLGPAPVGDGLFVTANGTNLGGDYDLVGQAASPGDAMLNLTRRTAWRDRFGLSGIPAGPALTDVLLQHMTIFSDPAGEDRVKPLVPSGRTVGGVWEIKYQLWLGGALATSKPFSLADLETTPLLDCLRRAYREQREDSFAGRSPSQHYRKFLGGLRRKYRIPHTNFIPGDLPDEGWLPPETTITESFNKADSTTLGPDQSWTEVVTDWEVFSNQARYVSGITADARCEGVVSSADHYGQASLITLNTAADAGFGAAARFAAAANTYYMAWVREPDNTQRIYKRVAGTLTELTSGTTLTISLPELYKCECNGSTIKGYQAGVERSSVSDSSITTGVRGGIAGYSGSTAPVCDLFEVSDLAAAGAFHLKTKTLKLMGKLLGRTG